MKTVISIIYFLFAFSAFAQNYQDGGPISLSASPKWATPKSVVELTGNVTTNDQAKTVKITIVHPNGQIENLQATATGAKNAYSLKFNKTQEVGSYTVTATGPDGKSKITQKFKIIAPLQLGQDAQKELVESLNFVEQRLVKIKEMVSNLPPSAEALELAQKAQEMEESLSQKLGDFNTVNGQLMKLIEVANRQPALADLMSDPLSQYGDWASDAQAQREHWKNLLAGQELKANLCDYIELSKESFAALSTALNFVGKGTDILVNIFLDKVVPAAINALPLQGANADQDKFIAVSATKNAAASIKGITSWVSSFLGLANDLAVYAMDKLMQAYCERFEGPFDAQFQANFRNGGQKFWNLGVHLKGKIFFHYPKQSVSGNGDVEVTGHMEGNAVGFTFWENIFAVEPIPASFILYKKFRILPIPFIDTVGNDPGFGMFARMGTPGYFYVPLKGKVKNKKLALELQDAKVDYSDSVYKVKVVTIFIQPALPVPNIRTFDFPINKGGFILTRGIQKGSTMDMAVNPQTKKTEVKKTFDRVWNSDDGEIDVTWKVDVQAKQN